MQGAAAERLSPTDGPLNVLTGKWMFVRTKNTPDARAEVRPPYNELKI